MADSDWEVVNTPEASNSGWEVLSKPDYGFSETAIKQKMGKPGYKVKYMTPDQYLEATPPLPSDANEGRKAKSLRESIDRGDQIEEIPSLEVGVNKEGATVMDYDGRHRALLAKERGLTLIPVAIKIQGKGNIDELIGTTGKHIPYSSFEDVPPPPNRTPVPWYEKAWTGAKDVLFTGPAQIGARMQDEGFSADPEAAEKQRQEQIATVDKTVKQDEQAYQGRRKLAGDTGFDWWRTGGSVAATLPLSAMGGLAGGATTAARLGGAALGGAAGAALEPVTEGDFAATKAKQVATGGAAGLIGGAGGEAASRVIAPRISEAANALLGFGVNLTPGQTMGGITRRIEEGMKSVPILGSAIRGAEGRGMADFNRATYDQVLEPLGVKYTGKEVGYEGVAAVEKKIGDAYDTLLPKVTLRSDGDLVKDLTTLKSMVSEMPSDQIRQFETIMQNRVVKRLGETGTMDGQTFKQVEGELSKLARDAHGSGDGAQRQLGDAIDEVNASLRANLERSNPGSRAELAKINGSWARFVRLRDAASRRSTSDGVFTPGDLLAAAKKGDRSVGKGAFARGDALLQDFARTGNKVLSNKLPDSGTAERLHMMDIPMAAAAIAPSMAYTSPAINALNAWSQPGLGRNMLAGFMRRVPPVLAPPAGAASAQLPQ